MASRFRLWLRGDDVRLERDGAEVRLHPRGRMLLAYLALEGPSARSRLAALLWPDAEPARARGNLRQFLSRLRSRAPGLVLDAPVRLSEQVDSDVDALLNDPIRHADAHGLLVASDASFNPELEAWLESQRSALQQTVHLRLEQIIGEAFASGRRDRALAAARAALAFDPTSDGAYRTLMDLQLRAGDAAGALATASACREALAAHLDATPPAPVLRLAEMASRLLAEQATAVPRWDRTADAPHAGGPQLRAADLSARSVTIKAESGGWLREAATLLSHAAADAPTLSHRGALLVQLAWIHHQLGSDGAATACAEEGVTALRAAADADSGPLVEGLFVLGSLAHHQGLHTAARVWWREALKRLQGAGEGADGGPGAARLHLAIAQVEDALGRVKVAREHYLAALARARPGRDAGTTAVAFNNLGHDALARGRTGDAQTLLVRACSVARRARDRRTEGYALDGAAQVALLEGDAERAREHAAAALQVARDLEDLPLQADVLITLADALRACGAQRQAAQVARAALRTALDLGRTPALARAAVAFLRDHGHEPEVEATLRQALARDARVPNALRESARAACDADGLTPRGPATLEEAVRVTVG